MKPGLKALFVLTSCALAGCYTSPEMTENKYRQYYSDTEICGTETMYQNKNLRDCIENRLVDEDLNKKTVSIIEVKNSLPLVVPKTDDDEEMLDVNRVYEVIDIRKDTSVVVENGVASEEETKKDEENVSDDIAKAEENVSDDTAKAEESVSQDNVADEVVVQEKATEVVETLESLEEKAENKLPEFVDGEMVNAPVVENHEESVQSDSIEVVDSVVRQGQDTVVNDLDKNEVLDEVIVEDSDVVQSKDGNTQLANGVTLVVGPLKEDLVIEVKTASGKKEDVSETKEVKTIKANDVQRKGMTTQKWRDMTIEQRREEFKKRRQEARERQKNMKNEKEVLPIEEK